MDLWNWILPKGPAGASAPEAPQGPRKWLPVINRDYCNGCNLCVQVCSHGCLGLVWDFSTVLHPELCDGEGNCMNVCPDHLITLQWVPFEGPSVRGILEEPPKRGEAG